MLTLRFIVISLLLCLQANAGIIPIQEVFEPAGDFPAEQYAKVAVLQWAPSDDAPLGDQELADLHKQKNITKLEHYIREAAAAGAELIVTPEFGIVGYPDIPELPSAEDNFRNREDIAPYVETIPGPATEHFANLAKELGIYIHFGLAEKDTLTDLYYNSVAVVAPSGELVTSYRKQHLFQLEYNYLASGTNNVTYDSPFGKVGLIICSDVYTPSIINGYRNEAIDLIALSTSWTQYNSGWGYFTRAATQTNAVMLAANHDYYPDSGVINANGQAQSHIRQSSGLAYGYVLRKLQD
jgi:predicted amidohydrolase